MVGIGVAVVVLVVGDGAIYTIYALEGEEDTNIPHSGRDASRKSYPTYFRAILNMGPTEMGVGPGP